MAEKCAVCGVFHDETGGEDEEEDHTQAVVEYWLKYYTTTHCTLCGDTGQIDTRTTARTADGELVGLVQWCICPNGQYYRELATHGA